MKNLKDILKDIKEGTSVSEILALLREQGYVSPKTEIKSEEEYCEMLDKEFRFGSDEYRDLDEPFWAYENFFPTNEYGSKEVGDGAWIKIKTDVGYNVYYAKRTKKQFNKTNIERKIRTIQTNSNKILDEAQRTIDHKKAMALIEKGSAKMEISKELVNELQRAEMIERLGIQPYCVKYRVGKSKWVTVMPHEYELCNGIEMYVNVIAEMGKTTAVTYKSLFTSMDNDVVFYLQSRGISKDMAVIMSKLKECYFIINVPEMMRLVIQPAA